MAAKKREFQLQFAGIKENKIHSERLTSSPPAVTFIHNLQPVKENE